jgi:hypothetical protein
LETVGMIHGDGITVGTHGAAVGIHGVIHMVGTHGIHGMLGTIHGDGITVGTHGAVVGITAGTMAGEVVGIMETGIVSIHRKDVFPER